MDTSSVSRRNTEQKKRILETLIALGSHVSAGAVYRELQKTHPTIGRATVYRVLADMAADGVLLRIRVPGEEDRYDITVRPHDHVVCRRCGKVADVWLDEPFDPAEHIAVSSGFTVEKGSLTFMGLCADCRAAESEENK